MADKQIPLTIAADLYQKMVAAHYRWVVYKEAAEALKYEYQTAKGNFHVHKTEEGIGYEEIVDKVREIADGTYTG